jgi:hypothetical protein
LLHKAKYKENLAGANPLGELRPPIAHIKARQTPSL